MMKKIIPIGLLLISTALFFFSVFKNIQYPLMWGDEAETALYARRILTYGYPKVHDGKNTLDQHRVPGDVGVNKKYDLYTIEMWGQYYFGAIGEYFAQQTSDFYLKTTILRSSFAIMGILGIFTLPMLFFLTLFLLANTFPPAYLAMTMSFAIYILLINFKIDITDFIKNILKKENLLALSPIVLSVLLYLPITIFFETSKAAQSAYVSMNYNFSTYLSYFFRILVFLAKYHLLYIAIYLKIILFFQSKENKKLSQYDELKNYDKLSFLLTLIFIVNLFTIPLTPFIFDRYFVFLQPLLSMIIIIDSLGVYEFIKINNKSQAKNILSIHFYLIFLLFIIAQITNFDNLKGHTYELTHKYEGSMDKVIFYIKNKYPHPENISIFTPIEKLDLIYYLNSKVLCDDDVNCYKNPPDIFIPRKYVSSRDLIDRYNNYMKESKYTKINLPILDYPVNNIPEFSLSLRHLYKTPVESDPNYQIYLYVKEE